jgi:regulator of protease activity HflC (stomatin/prohibitin superfamily)
MNMRNVLLLSAASLMLVACGPTVQPGNVGILIKNYGAGAGVQPGALPVGYHFTGPGESIVEYPVITRTYQWTKPGDGDKNNVDEQFSFNDSTGLPLTADVSITMRVDPAKVSALYTQYRLDFDALRDGPVRAYVRTSIALEASKYTSDQLYTAQRQQVIQNALKDIQSHFAGSGVEITDLQWIGSIRFPASVSQAIENKTKADQEAQVALRQVDVNKALAEAKVAEAEGEAAANVARAKGEAEALKVKGEAIRSNPQTLQDKYLDVLKENWDGKLPETIVGGGGQNPVMMLQPK